jgi:hypothetical protein
MMPYLNIQVQLVDTPPVTFEGARVWLPNVVRGADALILVIDLAEDPLAEMEMVLETLRGWKIFPGGMEEEFHAEPGFGKILIPALVLATKTDVEGAGENLEVFLELYRSRFPVFAVSAEKDTGLEDWKAELFSLLRIIRVYTKRPGKVADLSDPVTLPVGSTAEDFAESIHKDIKSGLKYAKIWGSGKFDGQKVTRDFVLQDEDIVEVHV